MCKEGTHDVDRGIKYTVTEIGNEEASGYHVVGELCARCVINMGCLSVLPVAPLLSLYTTDPRDNQFAAWVMDIN